MPVVGGSFGKSATVALPKDKPSGKFVVHTLSSGSGQTVGAKDVAVTKLLVKDWTTGKTLTDYSSAPLVDPLAQGSIAALEKGLVGHKVGSRVLVVAPPAAAAGQMDTSQLKISASDTLVFVLDITQDVAPDAQASGTPQTEPAGLPKVDASGKKAATITVPSGVKAPTTLKTAVLVKGHGPKVAAGQTVVVQYTLATWANGGKSLQSTWDSGSPFSTQIGVGSVVKGWDQGLVGQTVGSRVLLVIPPSLGYGSSAQGSIPANSTLVFVVDILGAA